MPKLTFSASAYYLDNKRLNKQVAECGQILRQLDCWPNGAWAKHPAVMMWIGYDEALWVYTRACELERLARGMKPHAEMAKFPEYDSLDLCAVTLPPWWGGKIHASHKAVLDAKTAGIPRPDYQHLYYWPTKDGVFNVKI